MLSDETTGSVIFNHFYQALVHKDTIAVGEGGGAFFFDANLVLLPVTYDEDVNLEDRLIDQPEGFLDRLLVDGDHESAHELVEVVFQTMFFGLSEFDGEFHRQFFLSGLSMHEPCHAGRFAMAMN